MRRESATNPVKPHGLAVYQLASGIGSVYVLVIAGSVVFASVSPFHRLRHKLAALVLLLGVSSGIRFYLEGSGPTRTLSGFDKVSDWIVTITGTVGLLALVFGRLEGSKLRAAVLAVACGIAIYWFFEMVFGHLP